MSAQDFPLGYPHAFGTSAEPTPDDEYTPTTEAVRVTYGAGAYRSWIGTQPGLNAFDRWLAQHDAEVRADERAQVRQRYADALAADERCGYDDAFGIATARIAR